MYYLLLKKIVMYKLNVLNNTDKYIIIVHICYKLATIYNIHSSVLNLKKY